MTQAAKPGMVGQYSHRVFLIPEFRIGEIRYEGAGDRSHGSCRWDRVLYPEFDEPNRQG